jgi:putative ABC transport system permease protein
MRAYRLLLLLLPASFRAEYGGEMSTIFAQRRRDARGPLAAFVLWLDAFVDVVSSALRVHADILRQDLRYVGRTLRHSPGFALTVVAVAALGVGATTAAFSVTDHVLVRPLPFPESDRILQLWQDQVARGYHDMELSPANYRDWKRMSMSFEAMAAQHSLSVNMVGEGEPERLQGAAVTDEILAVLGTKPLLGRGFTVDDDREGAPGTVLLSYGLWQGRFGGDPSVLGRKLILDDAPHEVIGVMPQGFRFPRRETRFWTAMRLGKESFERRDDFYLEVVARLKKGLSLEQARAEMQLVAGQLEKQYPEVNDRIGASVVPLRDQVTRQARLLLMALFGAALGVLLIACTNLASLFLARALQRRKEISVRAALGAGRERLVRQLLTESFLLAAAGGTLGVLLAVSALPLAVRLVPNSLPIAEIPPLDLRILAFAALMTLVTAVGFGLVPALRVFRDTDPSGLREGSRSGIGRKERLRSALVVAEVTVCMVLLISSGLLIRALLRVQAVDPGFRSEGVLTLRTWLPLPKYEETARRARFYEAVLADVRALPGVKGAGYISYLPLTMRGGIWGIEAEGQPAERGDESTASIRYVTPGLFGALGIPVLRGREVSEVDTEGALSAAVVSESFAARYWPGQDPLGRRFRFGLLGGTRLSTIGSFQDRTVVGVVGDVRVRGLERESEPQVYLPYRQAPGGAMSWYTPKDLAVKSDADPAVLVPALRQIIARADPAQPISDIRPLSAIVEAETAPRRVQVRVLGAFAAVALLLAGIGIHGLLAFTVSNRAPEIGVRLALGAQRTDILGLVLRHGLVLGGVGVALGLALAFAAGQGLEALLAGVSPRDAASFLAAAALAVSMAFLGSLFPALRAIRVDPLTVMRAE